MATPAVASDTSSKKTVIIRGGYYPVRLTTSVGETPMNMAAVEALLLGILRQMLWAKKSGN